MSETKRDRDTDTETLKRLAESLPGSRVTTDNDGLSKLRIPVALPKDN